jgi:hypothetical protein
MTVVVIVAVVVTALLIARLAWRAVWSEKRSIDHHEHAMEVLRDLSSRAGSDGLGASKGAAKGKEPKPHVYPGQGARRPPAAGPARAPAAGSHQAAAERSRAGGMTGSVEPKDLVGGRAAGRHPAPGRAPGPERAPVSEGQRETPEAPSKPPIVFIADDLAVEAPPASRRPAGAVPGRGRGGPGTPPPPAADEAGWRSPPGEDAALAAAADERPAVVGAAVAGRLLKSFRSLGHAREYRPRFGLAVGLAAIVLAAAAIAGVLVSTRPFSASEQHQLTRTSQSHKHPGQLPPPTTQAVVTAVSSDNLGAQYKAPAGNFTVVVTASAPCWTEVAATSGGTILSEQTLTQGQVKTIPANSSLWVRLGDPSNVKVTMNGMVVQLPPSVDGSPYNLTFSSS